MEAPYPIEATEFWEGRKDEPNIKNSPHKVNRRNEDELVKVSPSGLNEDKDKT